MEVLQLVITMVVIILGITAVAFLNKKYELGLNDMSSLYGVADDNTRELSKLLQVKEQEIDDLKDRVQVLEQLIVGPFHKVNQFTQPF